MKEYIISKDREYMIQEICLEEIGRPPTSIEKTPKRVTIRFDKALTSAELKKLKNRVQVELQMYVSEREVTESE